MAEKICSECISPSIVDGVLYWYQGDTFAYNLLLNLTAMGEKHQLSDTDRVEVVFKDRTGYAVKTFTAIAENGNRITLLFDKEVTSAFDKGRYVYDVCIVNSNGIRTTVANDNVAVVM